MVFRRMKSSPIKYECNRGKKCLMPYCSSLAKAKGLCMKCYQLVLKKKGDYEVNKSKSD
jgi:hypothetical protein